MLASSALLAAHHAEPSKAFFDRVEPVRIPETILRHSSQDWAVRVGLDELTNAGGIARFGRFEPSSGSLPQLLTVHCYGHSCEDFTFLPQHLRFCHGFRDQPRCAELVRDRISIPKARRPISSAWPQVG